MRGKGRIKKIPACHPDRDYYARGMCKVCYGRKALSMRRTKATCHPDKPHFAKGLCSTCYITGQRKKNPERRRYHDRKKHLRATYGMTILEYETMLAAQDNRCFLCNKIQDNRRRLCIDHNHATGVVRKLLCNPCNTKVGFYELLCSCCLDKLGYFSGPEELDRVKIYIETYK